MDWTLESPSRDTNSGNEDYSESQKGRVGLSMDPTMGDSIGPVVAKELDHALIPIYEGLRASSVDEAFMASYSKLTNLFKSHDKPSVPKELVQTALRGSGRGVNLDRLTERIASLIHALQTIRIDANIKVLLTGQGLSKLIVFPPEGMERALGLAVEEIGGRVVLPTILGAEAPDEVTEARIALVMQLGSEASVVQTQKSSGRRTVMQEERLPFLPGWCQLSGDVRKVAGVATVHTNNYRTSLDLATRLCVSLYRWPDYRGSRCSRGSVFFWWFFWLRYVAMGLPVASRTFFLCWSSAELWSSPLSSLVFPYCKVFEFGLAFGGKDAR